MKIIDGKDPPPFGLITPDALSPCLFTLLQQLGEERVNKASSPSTAWVRTSARELRNLSGPCQTMLCATGLLQEGGLGRFREAHKTSDSNRLRADVREHRGYKAAQR